MVVGVERIPMEAAALGLLGNLGGATPHGPRTALAHPPRSLDAEGLLTEFPAGRSPGEIGRRVAERFVADPLSSDRGEPIHCAEACAFYGSLAVARRLGDRDLEARLVKKLAPLLSAPGSAWVPTRPHVEDRVFGIVPLEAYRHGRSSEHLALGLGLADAQWRSTSTDGITSEARYRVDDMYMITALQVQAFRATGAVRYLERAARTVIAYLERLQEPSGLFAHTLSSPAHWGRGNGWAAAGMTELLLALPAEHPYRPRVLEGYRLMLSALLAHQNADGLWHQIVDAPEAWIETSASGMFTFAMLTGVKHGWVDEPSYARAARKAWLGLTAYLDDEARLREVCGNGGDGNSEAGATRSAEVGYHLSRPRRAGDVHGQAPLLWCAASLLP